MKQSRTITGKPKNPHQTLFQLARERAGFKPIVKYDRHFARGKRYGRA